MLMGEAEKQIKVYISLRPWMDPNVSGIKNTCMYLQCVNICFYLSVYHLCRCPRRPEAPGAEVAGGYEPPMYDVLAGT